MSVSVIPERHDGVVPKAKIRVEAKTEAFTIKHDSTVAGDGLYSVSEFQAIGHLTDCY